MPNFFKFSKWELLLIAFLLLLVGIPWYLRFQRGWSPLEATERTAVTVVRMASPKTDSLNMEKYQLEGVVYAAVAEKSKLPSRLNLTELLRFDQGTVKLGNEIDSVGMIELAPMSQVEPVHAFNEKILLVTGARGSAQ